MQAAKLLGLKTVPTCPLSHLSDADKHAYVLADAYVNPRRAPTRVNEIWPLLGEAGATWGVTANALPLAPGAMLTLTVGDQ